MIQKFKKTSKILLQLKKSIYISLLLPTIDQLRPFDNQQFYSELLIFNNIP